MKPLTTTIRRPGRKQVGNESLLAGKRYEVECETTGSRPPAVITWYKGRRRQLKHTKVRERSFLLLPSTDRDYSFRSKIFAQLGTIIPISGVEICRAGQDKR